MVQCKLSVRYRARKLSSSNLALGNTLPSLAEGMEGYNQLHEEVHQDQLSSEGQRFEIEFKNKM
jgi:hypothetical protein